MSNASDVVEQAMGKIQGQIDAAKNALIGLAGAFSIGALTDMVAQTIEATAQLEKFSEKTGASVEALSALRSAAKITGTDFESVTTGIGKLDQAIVNAAQGTGKAVDVFASLGVSLRDASGNLRSTDDVMLDVATAFSGMESGAVKTADAVALFGRAGKELIPVLNELGEQGQYVAKVTTEQAAQAQDLEENWRRLGSQTAALKLIVASDLTPALDALVQTFIDAQKEGGGLLGIAKDLSQDGSLKQWAYEAGLYIAQLADKTIDAQNTLKDFGGFLAGLLVAGRGIWDQAAGGLAQAFGQIETGEQLFTEGAAKVESGITGIGDSFTTTAGEPSSKFQNAFIDHIAALDAFGVKAKAAGGSVDDLQAKIVDFTSQINSLQLQLGKITGDDGGYTELAKAIATVDKAWDEGKPIIQDQVNQYIALAKAVDEARMKKAADADALKEWNAQQQELNKSLDSYAGFLDKLKQKEADYLTNLGSMVQKSEDEVTALGLSSVAAQNLNVERQAEIELQKQLAPLRAAGLQDLVDEATQAKQTAIDVITANNAKAQSIKDWRTVLDEATGALSNFFVDLAQHGTKAFKDLWDSFLQFALKALADVAAKAVVVNIVQAFSTQGSPLAIAGAGLAGSNTGAGGILNTVTNGFFSGSGGAGSTIANGIANITGPSNFTANLAGDAYLPGALAGGASDASGGSILGSLGGLGALGGVLGVAGLAAGAYALYNALVGDKHGPKVGGVAGSVAGLNQYGGETTDQGNQTAGAILQAIQQSFASDYAKLGGTGTPTANFGISFDTDPQGTAQSRLSGAVTVGGQSIYSLTDLNAGRDQSTFQSTSQLVSYREELAALQASALPPAVLAVLQSVPAASASLQQIADVLSRAQQANATGAANLNGAAVNLNNVANLLSGFNSNLLSGFNFNPLPFNLTPASSPHP
jgi:hypothetical protein